MGRFWISQNRLASGAFNSMRPRTVLATVPLRSLITCEALGRLVLRFGRTRKVISNGQWHRIRFSRDEVISGAMSRFLVDSLLPAIEELGDVDLRTVAIFDVDDAAGANYLYLSPDAFSAFLTLALAHGAQPCDPPAPESASLLYGDVLEAPGLLVR